MKKDRRIIPPREGGTRAIEPQRRAAAAIQEAAEEGIALDNITREIGHYARMH